jgi:hypothetical protein
MPILTDPIWLVVPLCLPANVTSLYCSRHAPSGPITNIYDPVVSTALIYISTRCLNNLGRLYWSCFKNTPNKQNRAELLTNLKPRHITASVLAIIVR